MASLIACAAFLAACGSPAAAPVAPWRAAHPDPQGITFDETAPGVCAVTVRYPDQAPAAIDYLGSTYIQTSMATRPSAPPGTVIAASGDWTLRRVGAQLALLTPAAIFTYRTSSGC